MSASIVRNVISDVAQTPATAMPKVGVQKAAELAGRVLLAGLFLVSGLGKIGAYTVTAGYMQAVGLPSALLPIVIALEVLGAAAIVVGWRTRITAFLLAGFTLVSALLFHNDFGNQVEMVMFLKNVSIAGGFLLLVANGAGPVSLDARRAASSRRQQ